MSYWQQRTDLNYYRVIREWLEATPGDSLIDVGAFDTPVATWGQFTTRYAVDLYSEPDLPGVIGVCDDWIEWAPPFRFDVLTCLQVIEHLPDDAVRPFVDRLFARSRVQIVSVPWKWPAGRCKWHLQDPIDDAKFCRLMSGRVPVQRQVVTDDGVNRLIARFEG